MSGSADSRTMAMRNRLNIIKQTVLRNDHFSPSTLPSRDREHLLTVFVLLTQIYNFIHPYPDEINETTTRTGRRTIFVARDAGTL